MKKNIAKAKQFYILPLVHDEACGCSSGVERNLAKVDVVGPNPIARSNNKRVAFIATFFCYPEWRDKEPRRSGSDYKRKPSGSTAVGGCR